jgi:hypothetical protein
VGANDSFVDIPEVEEDLFELLVFTQTPPIALEDSQVDPPHHRELVFSQHQFVASHRVVMHHEQVLQLLVRVLRQRLHDGFHLTAASVWLHTARLGVVKAAFHFH